MCKDRGKASKLIGLTIILLLKMNRNMKNSPKKNSSRIHFLGILILENPLNGNAIVGALFLVKLISLVVDYHPAAAPATILNYTATSTPCPVLNAMNLESPYVFERTGDASGSGC